MVRRRVKPNQTRVAGAVHSVHAASAIFILESAQKRFEVARAIEVLGKQREN
jgi:hypothetical protein